MGDDLDLAVADLLDVDGVAEVARAAVDLDALVQELLERRQVEDLVRHRLAAVDGVFAGRLGGLGSFGAGFGGGFLWEGDR